MLSSPQLRKAETVPLSQMWKGSGTGPRAQNWGSNPSFMIPKVTLVPRPGTPSPVSHCVLVPVDFYRRRVSHFGLLQLPRLLGMDTSADCPTKRESLQLWGHPNTAVTIAAEGAPRRGKEGPKAGLLLVACGVGNAAHVVLCKVSHLAAKADR